MDKTVVEQKLESLRRCVTRVEAKRPATVEALTAAPDLQDILVLNLSRAVQVCVDIACHLISEAELPAPQTMGESFAILAELGVIGQELSENLKRSVGFRKIAIHNYQAIDWRVVFAICTRHLDDFRQFSAAVVSHCDL